MDETMEEIESLLDSYVSAYDDYHRSNTCNSQTYKQQEQTMYDKRYELLNMIRKSIKE